ncbi:unnamed protein product [Fraxinus pennsylvanica]|uniref:Endonuclease/exonuclease/phosphatase domain-containing protein n=1 Tax=Fraxinus pennsylvanica TaxID=56036 RepID=A0AAD2AAN4_9LAMI|nr:unnamed protein product [Fraxinus pennsylvanica]
MVVGAGWSGWWCIFVVVLVGGWLLVSSLCGNSPGFVRSSLTVLVKGLCVLLVDGDLESGRLPLCCFWVVFGMGYLGPKFTWSNKREGTQFTKERLDRAVVNPSFLSVFSACVVQVLPVITSDHNPLLINCSIQHDTGDFHRPKLFRYEATWSGKQDCKKIVEDAWSLPRVLRHPFRWFKEGLERCRVNLQSWATRSAGAQRAELKCNMQKLLRLQKTNRGELNELFLASTVKKEVIDGGAYGSVVATVAKALQAG